MGLKLGWQNQVNAPVPKTGFRKEFWVQIPAPANDLADLMHKARTVMAFGSFDLLHPGHLLYLRKARQLGDRLIVVVARDSSIERFKHRKPVMGERTRLAVINALKTVDNAVLGNRLSTPTDMYRILKRYRPDVIAFGYDQRIGFDGIKEWLKENGLKPKVVLIRARDNVGVFKSTKLRKRLSRLP